MYLKDIYTIVQIIEKKIAIHLGSQSQAHHSHIPNQKIYSQKIPMPLFSHQNRATSVSWKKRTSPLVVNFDETSSWSWTRLRPFAHIDWKEETNLSLWDTVHWGTAPRKCTIEWFESHFHTKDRSRGYTGGVHMLQKLVTKWRSSQ